MCHIFTIWLGPRGHSLLITLSSKYNHITPVLKYLHWPPITEHIKFKILIITFKALHNLSPWYLQ